MLLTLSETSQKYRNLKIKQESELETYGRTQKSILEKQEDELTAKFDANDRTQNHINIDLDDVEKQQHTIEDAIHVETKDVAEERTQLESEHVRLESELAELKRKVAEKEAEIQITLAQKKRS